MVGKDDKKYVIWPAYFDKRLSKKDGRRVPKSLAIEAPSIEKIVKVAQSLGLNPVVEKDAKYPSRQWETKGRVLVDKGKSKVIILKEMVSHFLAI